MAQTVGIYVCYLGIGEKLPEASYLFLVTAVKPYNGAGFGVVICAYQRFKVKPFLNFPKQKIGACAYYNGVSLSLLKPGKYLFFVFIPKLVNGFV